MFKFKRDSQYRTSNNERYLPLLAMLVISAQLAAHVLGPRSISMGDLVLPGGILSFPLTFFLWDIITEVYGFQRARQIIYYNVICQIFFAGILYVSLQTTPDPKIIDAAGFTTILGSVPKITFAVIIAIFLGDYANCYVLQKLKVYTHKRHLWFRLIGATAIGEAITSIIWVSIFYWHTKIHPDLIKLIYSQYLFKIFFEIILVPITYLVVAFLQNKDDFSPTKKYLNFDPKTLKITASK